MIKELFTRCSLACALLFGTAAHAAFFDRGNGLIYDDLLNISWTKNGSLFPDPMSWASGQSATANLLFAGFDDFRQPTLNELYVLYTELPGNFGTSKVGNVGLFEGIRFQVWSGELLNQDPNQPLFMGFNDGVARIGSAAGRGAVWAVRAGDSIPEPGSMLLAGLGLGVLWVSRWRRHWR